MHVHAWDNYVARDMNKIITDTETAEINFLVSIIKANG